MTRRRAKKPADPNALPKVSGKAQGTLGAAYGGMSAQAGFASMPQFAHTEKPPALWALDSTGILKLDFHPGQSRVWNSQKRFLFMLAGTQGG